jgi:hypothetical protein
MPKTLNNGILIVEALRFMLACCEATEAGADRPIDEVYNDYTEEEQFALAISFAENIDQPVRMMKMYFVTRLLENPRFHAMTMSSSKACEVFLAMHERAKHSTKN